MQYSFNRDYSSLSGTNIPYEILNANFEKVISTTAPVSANSVFTGDLGGIYVVPDFSVADNFISDTNFFVDFGDGTIIENNLSAFHRYSTPGNFPVTLVVTSSAGFLFKAFRNYVLNVVDPVPDKIFLTQDKKAQFESESTTKFYITRFNSLNTSQELSANDYSIKLSVDGNTSPLQFESEYLDNENFQYQNKSFFFTSPDEKFEVIEKVKTSNTLIYGKISNNGNLILSTLSAADNQLVGTSGYGSFRYYEPSFFFLNKEKPFSLPFGFSLNLSADVQSVSEGGTAIISLSTKRIPDGYQVPYTITDVSNNITSEFSPGVTSQDIQQDLTGFFTVNNNQSFLTINVNEDVFIEGEETLRLTLNDFGNFYDLKITDTTTLSTLNYASTLVNTLSTLEVFLPSIVERYASTLVNTLSTPEIIPPLTLHYASTLVNSTIIPFSTPVPTTQNYASTLDNTSFPPTIVEKYALTLDNTSFPPTIVEKYALTLVNTSFAPPVPEHYGLTLVNNSLTPSITENYALTLNNISFPQAITENYASTLVNSSIATPPIYGTGPPPGDWLNVGDTIGGFLRQGWAGSSVSINSTGDRVAIGAPSDGTQLGRTYIYEYNGSSWVKLGGTIATYGRSGSSVSMDSTGDRVAIGAPSQNGADFTVSQSGGTSIYEYNGTNWVQLGSTIFGEAELDGSGGSVSLSSDGTRVAIGANGNDGGGSKAGHTRIYEYNGSSWVQLGSDINGGAGDRSGVVRMNSAGNRVAIGSPTSIEYTSVPGKVRIYEYNGSDWAQLGSDIEGEGENGLLRKLGSSVDINSTGDRVVIGAPYKNDEAGQVRIYEYNGSDWVQLGSDIDGEYQTINYFGGTTPVQSGTIFGTSVSMNSTGDKIAIGAPKGNISNNLPNADSGVNVGRTSIYEYNGTNWIQVGTNITGHFLGQGDKAGVSVSMDSTGDKVAIGAYFSDLGDFNAGRVDVFEI